MTIDRAPTLRTLVKRLHDIRNQFTPESATEKRQIIETITTRPVQAPHLLRKLHATLCFLLAFPDDAPVFAAARDLLASFGERIAQLRTTPRRSLDESGIAGTSVHYEFSFPAASWLAECFPDDVEINWAAFEHPERLDEILVHLIAHAELQTFDDGEVGTPDWIRFAKGPAKVTDLAWLLRQVRSARKLQPVRAHLYDAAEVPLAWALNLAGGSKTYNRWEIAAPAYRPNGLRRLSGPAVDEICRPGSNIELLPAKRGERLIQVAVAALAVRHREVYAFNHANPHEVYLADLGQGAQLAVFGVRPGSRFNLEGNYGYLLLANGFPVGYGGASPLFDQVNTGINIFEEFRGSEAAVLFTRTLRVFRTLFGCTRFIASPDQLGRDNREAIGSGAFWFYYKLGFRPIAEAARREADREVSRLRRSRRARSDTATLRRLAHDDVQLVLPGAKRRPLFEESWLGVCAAGVTQIIAEQGCALRHRAITRIVADVARRLGVRDRRSWPPAQRRAFAQLAPLVALIQGMAKWPIADRRALIQLMRAKGDACERSYVTQLRNHKRFRKGLADYCSG